jgi:serine/threonine-protein kinase HipA
LSPLYDVVPRPTHASERFLHLGIGPQGRLATLTNAMGWAARFGLTRDKALAIVDRLWRVVREWKGRFEDYGVPAVEIDKVSSAFRHAREVGGVELGL